MGNKVYKAVDMVLSVHSQDIKDLAVKMANTAVQVAETHNIKQFRKGGKSYPMTEDFYLFHRDLVNLHRGLVNMALEEFSLEIQLQLILIWLKKLAKE